MNRNVQALAGDFHKDAPAGSERLTISRESAIVACKVFVPEMETLGVDPCQIHYLDQGLHRYPNDLRAELTTLLKEIERDAQARSIVLAYGYCGGGLEGLVSERLPMTIPLVHDCIPLLLGHNPGGADEQACSTFYLSAGWVEYGRTPLTEFRESSKRLGSEDALWAVREMTKAYREVGLIDNGTPLKCQYQEYAHDMAELLGLDFCPVQGNLKWLADLVQGRSSKRIVTVRPGTEIRKDLYFQSEPLSPSWEASP